MKFTGHITFFPGVIFHELSHWIALKIFGVKVHKTKLWGVHSASVTHERTGSTRNVFVSSAPFFFGTITTSILIALAFLGIKFVPSTIIDYSSIALFFYVGASIAYHCIPSSTDAKNAIQTLNKEWEDNLLFKHGFVSAILHLLLLPFVFLPLLLFSYAMLFFSTKKHLGLAWFSMQLVIIGFFLL